MSDMVIEVERRETRGTGPNRRLRTQGLIPAVVYGGGKETVPISIERRAVLDLLKESGSEHAVFLLKLKGTGKERHTMIRDMQVDPITHQILHIDFLRVVMSESVRVQVPIEIRGTAQGVKNEGGILDFVTREVEIECLPGDIPRTVPVDVSALHVGQHVEAKELELPEKVKLLEDPSRVIVSIAHPRVVEAAVAEEGEGLLIETEPEEPEVIGRGKAEVEEEDEG